jgi:2-(3-amino-3-carboxypropyl)histidine synthase
METRKINGIKTIFVHARAENINLIPVLNKLKIKEKSIGLVSAIQYRDYLDQAKKHLKKKGFQVEIAGQIVGCNASRAIKLKEKVDAFVFIGSGEFHPLELISATKINSLYFANPVSGKVSKFEKNELERLEKQEKGRIRKYFIADKIGVLVSSKPGQENLRAALKFAKECGKDAYVFLDNEIDVNRLEDFNNIKMWVNTSCPRLEGKNIISLREILKFNQKI